MDHLAADAAGNPLLYNGRVMEALETLQDDEMDDRRRWLVLDMVVGERDAIHAVGFLHCLLRQERTASNENNNQNNNNNNSSSRTRATGLVLEGREISDEASEILCDFIRRTTDLPALDITDVPTYQYHRLLAALQINTSVKSFHIEQNANNVYDFGERIASLLRHRNDLEVLDIDGCEAIFPISQVLPFIRNGLPRLRKLRFSACELKDDDIQAIIQALLDGNHGPVIEELDLSKNYTHITSRGLRSLCALAPSVFSCLQKLNLNCNYELVDDLNIVQLFIQEVLLAPTTTLKELHLAFSMSEDPKSFVLLIKVLETNRSIRLLDIQDIDFELQAVQEPIHDQLVESLPSMKGIRELSCDWEHFTEDNMALITNAVRKNTSLYQFSTHDDDGTIVPFTTPILTAIFKRNKYLTLLDDLMGTTNSTSAAPSLTATTGTTAIPIIPNGLWTKVLETVGQGAEGASPVFKVLQARLASWPQESYTSHGSNKRKRQDTTQQQEGRP